MLLAVIAVGLSAQTASASRALSEFLEYGWGFEIGEDLEDLTRQFGRPRRIDRKQVRNLHSRKQIDEVYEVHYDGVKIRKYRVKPRGADPYELLLGITIGSSRHKTTHALHIGCSSSKVKRVLGKPETERDNKLSYLEPESNASVTFHIESGKVHTIEWTFPVD